MENELGREQPPGQCPFGHGVKEPHAYGQTDLTYNGYLRIPELLKLQLPQSDPAHHDELLFITIHQSYELWFKLILHEMNQAIFHLGKTEVLKANHFMRRIVEILRMLVPQIHILETMKPVDFLQFRNWLRPASGFQSLQFREVEFMAGLKDERYLAFFKNDPVMLEALRGRMAQLDLKTAYLNALNELGYEVPLSNGKEGLDAQSKALLPIYQKPDEHLPIYLLSESLVEFDEYLGLWREHHVRVVERIIGFKMGTGGSSGVEYLKTTTSKKCFPFLWEVRTLLV